MNLLNPIPVFVSVSSRIVLKHFAYNISSRIRKNIKDTFRFTHLRKSSHIIVYFIIVEKAFELNSLLVFLRLQDNVK